MQYKILVQNEMSSEMQFFFFQEPAIYTGGAEVYSNSLIHGTLPPRGSSGPVGQLIFIVENTYYAGVQQQLDMKNAPGSVSGKDTVLMKIDLTPDNANGVENCTTMSLEPLNLRPPMWEDGVEAGAYRIKTPRFSLDAHRINAGLGIVKDGGEQTLSNFILALPNQNIDVQPKMVFYVQTGSFTAGTTVNFTESSRDAGRCDATYGKNKFTVVYKNDGTFQVK